jgi:hypothetical protein
MFSAKIFLSSSSTSFRSVSSADKDLHLLMIIQREKK